MKEYCVCGHVESDHNIYGYNICWNCSVKTGKFEHAFKLDNLRLVEDLAKKRNLF